MSIDGSGAHERFVERHIGPSAGEVEAMLATLQLPSLDALVQAVVPEAIRLAGDLDLPEPMPEFQALQSLQRLAARNRPMRSFIGMGYHATRLPAVIARNVLENPAWYTAYTPYQAEISQGRLEGMLNFQTLVCDLAGLPVANASLLDEATAAAEAMLMSRRSSTSTARVYFVSDQCHPQTLAVLRTRSEPMGIELRVGPVREALQAEAFGCLLQMPGTDGGLGWQDAGELARFAEALHARGALLTVAADPLALVLLSAPGDWGADIVIGSAQRFGLPLAFGGPHAAFMACRDALKRALPGRVVGVSVDAQGGPALRLALQTREQHIRREKATSNICTAQALLAVIAGFYAVYHGPQGLRRIAHRVHRMAAVLAAGLRQAKLQVAGSFFDTVTVCGVQAAAVLNQARERGIDLRELGPDAVAIALDETVEPADVETLWSLFGVNARFATLDGATADAMPPALLRRAPILQHLVFNSHHSETAMLRYLRQLADRDLALDRTMIPLGSCTMKLNATSEMIPVTWSQFAEVHPYAPADQVQGYRELTDALERWLAQCSGYDAVSLQPNAGSQGELTGLLAIRAWHQARGQAQRDVCLIPESAHGTNPASAHLAGLQVVPVGCDAAGNVDLADLTAKAERHAERLAALMITYPSTHGVFEEGIGAVCEVVHRHGGQVYVDGANLNALVGLAAPGRFGGDVSHLNLHKTFCIPHGGGGPGVGPVAVKSHLAAYLPGHVGAASAVGPVSAAPFGSAGILPIVWMYISMMGASGLKLATAVALLNANYVARRLAAHYPVLYSGRHGLVAHECIIDLRPLKDTSGVTAEDVAKRLMDYGFHAPTVSFPVAGTLMIEPTESEPKVELDRFIDAMVAIRDEIRDIELGRMDRDDNPLKNAPHTAAMIAADRWDHPYTRRQAAFPSGVSGRSKVWPAVARIDNVHGDRNLLCTCPPVSAYEAALR